MTASFERINGTSRTDLAILTLVRLTTAQVWKICFFSLEQWSQSGDFINEKIIICSAVLFVVLPERKCHGTYLHTVNQTRRHNLCEGM